MARRKSKTYMEMGTQAQSKTEAAQRSIEWPTRRICPPLH